MPHIAAATVVVVAATFQGEITYQTIRSYVPTHFKTQCILIQCILRRLHDLVHMVEAMKVVMLVAVVVTIHGDMNLNPLLPHRQVLMVVAGVLPHTPT